MLWPLLQAYKYKSKASFSILIKLVMAAVSSLIGVAALCPWARHMNPSLVLVKPRKTRPYITERLLMGRKESNKQIKFLNIGKQWRPRWYAAFYQDLHCAKTKKNKQYSVKIITGDPSIYTMGHPDILQNLWKIPLVCKEWMTNSSCYASSIYWWKDI